MTFQGRRSGRHCAGITATAPLEAGVAAGALRRPPRGMTPRGREDGAGRRGALLPSRPKASVAGGGDSGSAGARGSGFQAWDHENPGRVAVPASFAAAPSGDAVGSGQGSDGGGSTVDGSTRTDPGWIGSPRTGGLGSRGVPRGGGRGPRGGLEGQSGVRVERAFPGHRPLLLRRFFRPVHVREADARTPGAQARIVLRSPGGRY